jgi:non-heme chloroperoxidase
MTKKILWAVPLVMLLGSALYGQDTVGDGQGTDSSPHSVQFVAVDDNVKLEVLDWGGSGRPLVLLAGLGNTAHIFDRFALKLTPTYHVYGITRRGFGASSAPVPANNNYSSDRLGDDVLVVLDALKLNHPVLVGHSIAGEELSSVATRHPEKVGGLVYIDAGYPYAFYDRSHGDLTIDSLELRKELEQLQNIRYGMPGVGPPDQKPLIQELLQTTLPQVEKDLQAQQKWLQAAPPSSEGPSLPPVNLAILAGVAKYTDIRVPVLAFFAFPQDLAPTVFADDPAAHARLEAVNRADRDTQIKAFQSGIPSARVVRLPHANHFLFITNETDILREMNAFLEKLP